MKLFIKKDKIIRRLWKKKELSKLYWKLLNLFKISKLFFWKKKKKLNFPGIARIKNVCIYTRKSGAIYRVFRSSRFVLRGVSALGFLPGLRRSSW